MSQFPNPIPLPESVPLRRGERRWRLTQAILLGIVIRMIIVIAELVGYWCCGSSALMLEAISTSADLCSSLFLLACIYLADRSPDNEHPFGHGRYEPLGGLQLGLAILVIGVVMAVQEVGSFFGQPVHPPFEEPLYLIPLVAVVLLEIGYRALMLAARKYNSVALAADAVHFRVDALSSLIAVVALIGAALLPQFSGVFDHTGAVIIALFMSVVGAQAIYENLHQILDRKPDQEYFDRVREAALKVPGVKDTEKIRLQVYGPDAHVAIDIEVDPGLSVVVAHEITQQVRVEIQAAWPSVRDVVVHVEPYYPNDH